MTAKTEDNKAVSTGKIRINNVRLAFPSIWHKTQVNNSGEPAFRAAFIIPPNHPQLKDIQKIIADVAKAKWKDKAASILKTAQSVGKGGLQDGDLKEHLDGYAGNMYVNANNAKTRPDIRDRNKEVLTEDDNKPQGGDYVNAVVEFWAQDNQHGKRINASLLGIQFNKEGPKFAAGSVATDNDFEDLGDIGDEDYSGVA